MSDESHDWKVIIGHLHELTDQQLDYLLQMASQEKRTRTLAQRLENSHQAAQALTEALMSWRSDNGDHR
jgi:uncharacterized protein YgbK (DUF1537 family)